MERARALEVIEREADRILEIAQTGQSAAVPTCPDWTVADLLNHLGRVYAMVATTLGDPAGNPPDRQRIPTRPEDQDPADWMRKRLDLVLPMLAEIPDDQRRWNFVEGPASPVAFWWRRQVHETLIHRVDAELAVESQAGDAPADIAVDGIAERLLLCGFQEASPEALQGTSGLTIHLHATDVPDGEWSINAERLAYAEAHLKGDVALRGPAWSLNRWLWRRGSVAIDAAHGAALTDMEASGDLRAAEEWRPSF